MKKRKWIMIAIPVLLLLTFALTFVPHKVVDIDPARVSKIIVFNGNTGYEDIITGREEIKHIIANLNKVTFQKGKPSFGVMGYSFKTTFFDHSGDSIKQLTINSEDTIRYHGFFYRAVDDPIDYSYIEGLVRK